MINLLQLEEGEKIVYIVATDNYTGWMLFSFENGKSAKIELGSYATKTNRKKLANAYADQSPLIDTRYLESDMELVAYSSIKKVLIFNTMDINPKSSRNSQGVQVLKEKKGSFMCSIKTIDESDIKNPDYYRTRAIPAVGRYFREDDAEDKQIVIQFEE